MTTPRAIRSLLRSPGFTLWAALILGLASTGLLGVGTATWQLYFKPLPFAESEQLVVIHGYSQSMGLDIGVSAPLLAELDQVDGLVAVAGHEDGQDRTDADGVNWRTARIDASLPELLGMQPRLGRGFLVDDGDPGASTVALLAESVWHARFAGEESVLGREIELDGDRARIVGIMPDDLTVPDAAVQLWLPLKLGADQFSAENMSSFGGLRAIGRLQPELTPAVFEQRLQQHFADHPGLAPMVRFVALELRSADLRTHWTAGQRTPIAILAVAIAAVLLTAILNLAGLWMSRLLERGHTQAIEAALGAGRWQSLKTVAAEYLVVVMLAIGLALTLTGPCLRWLEQLGIIDDTVPITVSQGPGTALLALAVAVLAGLPILFAGWWQSRRLQRSPAGLLGSGGATMRQASPRVRRILIVVQFSVAMALLVCVGLLLRSWHGLLNEDIGFEPRQLLVTNLAGDLTISPAAVAESFERIAALPGVTTASHANAVPFGRIESVSSYRRPDGEDGDGIPARDRLVGPDFFQTVGIRLVTGRDFDRYAPGPDQAGVIIDETLARRYWPDGDAVGSRLAQAVPGNPVTHEIIGVVGNVRHMSLDEVPEMGTVYRFQPQPSGVIQLVLATNGSPSALVDPVRMVLEETLGQAAARSATVATMDSLLRRTVRDREPQIVLLSVFAALTLLLSATGLYAVMTWSVRARTTELGLRMALGADAGAVRKLILADTTWLLLLGLGLGGLLALIATRLVGSQLHGIGSTDPLTWLTAAITLSLVLLVAGWWPARRAARLLPLQALTGER